MSLLTRGTLWLGLYFHLIVLPLVVCGVWPGGNAGRPFLTQFGVACGYAALTILVLEFALISKIHAVSGVFGQDALQFFHRQMGLLATLLLTVHAVLMLSGGYPLAWANPFAADAPWAMRWGAAAGWAIIALILLSLFRRRLHFPYDWWQLSHGALAELAVVTAFAHIILFGGFSARRPVRVLLAGYALLFLALRVWFQWIKPWRMWSQPWEVVSNVAELGDSHTLTLRPDGHPGFVFEPGQFAWVCTGKTPFHKDRHPISMSSPAYDEPGCPIAFTIKALGDWSGEIVPTLQPGHRVWLDGPYGVFTADRCQGPGYVLIGGGAGIAPLFSICQTLALRGDSRPVYLFFGGHDSSRLIFREQLRELAQRMNLHTVFALEEPEPEWTGERGYITAEMLQKYLPAQFRRFPFFICGPEPMVASLEKILPALGVPAAQIQTERFVMV